MRTKIIILGLLSAIVNMSAKLIINKSAVNSSNTFITVPEAPAQPTFVTLADNIFLAIKVDQQLIVDDGDVVEFVFGKNDKLVTFHINDVNQDLLATGEANLMVMVHQDLALALKEKQLKHIKVLSKGRVITIPVNQNWQPDLYLTQL